MAHDEIRRVVGRRDYEEPESTRPEPDAEYDNKMRQRLEALAQKLERDADEQVARKTAIEDRWYEDLRNYYGRYETTTESDLKAANKSRVFVKLTRMKTHGWEARLSDMLFPTDDKNWGIKPTPVPEVESAIRENTSPIDVEKAKSDKEVATQRAEGMEAEIDDQLRETNYNIRSREIIHDWTKLGSGISKGPVLAEKTRRRWFGRKANGNNGQTLTVYELGESEDKRPEFVRVDPWNFFPDMSALKMSECEFTFERHLLPRKDLRKLARKPGFNKDAIRRLLEKGPQRGLPPYVGLLRDITNTGSTVQENRYWVWEYHGSLEREDLEALYWSVGDFKEIEALDDIDPLEEIQVVMWFCDGEVLKFGPHPMDSGDTLYSLVPFEKDDTSPFGLGVPYLMRDSQAAINGAWRMTMDNAELSVGPQIVADMTQIEPADGDWKLKGRKVWKRIKSAVQGAAPAFEAFNIPNNQAELERIILLARQFADDETNFPLVAQGESGAHQTTTAGGLAMLMNNSNVVFRRVVKNFDDFMTVPNIQRIYDWNMQFSDKENIKGDFDVDARGSSVLLVRELQAQNLMVMAMQFSVNPVLKPLLKITSLLRKLVQAHMLTPDEIVKTDDELKAEIEKEQANGGPPPDPEIVKLQIQQQIADEGNKTKLDIARLNRETEMIKLAEQRNMKLDDLKTKLAIADKTTQSKERLFAAETAVKQRFGEGI